MIHSLQTLATGYWKQLEPALNGWFYLPSSVGWWMLASASLALLLSGVVAGFVLRRNMFVPKLLVALPLVVFTAYLASWWTPTLLAGQPDPNCQKYGNGGVKFELASIAELPPEASAPYKDKSFLMVVLEPDWFGPQPHLCVVPFKAMGKLNQDYATMLKNMQQMMGDAYSRGSRIHFSFTGGMDGGPNIMDVPGVPQEKGPPDKPKSQDI